MGVTAERGPTLLCCVYAVCGFLQTFGGWLRKPDVIDGLGTEAVGFLVDAVFLAGILAWLRKKDRRRRTRGLAHSASRVLASYSGRFYDANLELIRNLQDLSIKSLQPSAQELNTLLVQMHRDRAIVFDVLENSALGDWDAVIEAAEDLIEDWLMQRLIDPRCDLADLDQKSVDDSRQRLRSKAESAGNVFLEFAAYLLWGCPDRPKRAQGGSPRSNMSDSTCAALLP